MRRSTANALESNGRTVKVFEYFHFDWDCGANQYDGRNGNGYQPIRRSCEGAAPDYPKRPSVQLMKNQTELPWVALYRRCVIAAQGLTQVSVRRESTAGANREGEV